MGTFFSCARLGKRNGEYSTWGSSMSARDAAVAASTELSRIKWSDGVHTVGVEWSGVGRYPIPCLLPSLCFIFIYSIIFIFFVSALINALVVSVLPAAAEVRIVTTYGLRCPGFSGNVIAGRDSNRGFTSLNAHLEIIRFDRQGS